MIEWLLKQDGKQNGKLNETISLQKIAKIMKRSIEESALGICKLEKNREAMQNRLGLTFLEQRMVDVKKESNDKIAKFESDLERMMTIYHTYPSTQGFSAMVATRIPEISKAMHRALIEMRKATSMNEAKKQKNSFLIQITQEIIVIANMK